MLLFCSPFFVAAIFLVLFACFAAVVGLVRSRFSICMPIWSSGSGGLSPSPSPPGFPLFVWVVLVCALGSRALPVMHPELSVIDDSCAGVLALFLSPGTLVGEGELRLPRQTLLKHNSNTHTHTKKKKHKRA